MQAIQHKISGGKHPDEKFILGGIEYVIENDKLVQ